MRHVPWCALLRHDRRTLRSILRLRTSLRPRLRPRSGTRLLPTLRPVLRHSPHLTVKIVDQQQQHRYRDEEAEEADPWDPHRQDPKHQGTHDRRTPVTVNEVFGCDATVRGIRQQRPRDGVEHHAKATDKARGNHDGPQQCRTDAVSNRQTAAYAADPAAVGAHQATAPDPHEESVYAVMFAHATITPRPNRRRHGGTP